MVRSSARQCSSRKLAVAARSQCGIVEEVDMNWWFAYAIGFHPWEDTDQPFARKISELFDREE